MTGDLGAEIQGHNDIFDDTEPSTMNNGRALKIRRCSNMPLPLQNDRLHDLPDEILCLILSMLQTKDALPMQLVSKRMRQAFTWITSLDFDDSPVSECPSERRHAKHSPVFQSFVDDTLKKYSDFGQPLTRFRLCLGGDKSRHYHFLGKRDECEDKTCYSHLRPDSLDKWICFPLEHSSLREVDISFHVSKPSDFELPAGIFTCQSLEVLKLDCNLKIVDDKIPRICLPNLKRLYLRSFVFTNDAFVTRLVQSCSALEDLCLTYCLLHDSDRLTISSHSLRKLVLDVWKHEPDEDHETVLINCPNLQYLYYDDLLPSSYSIVHMNALANAYVKISTKLGRGTKDAIFRSHHSLIRSFSHIQQLSLLGYFVENLYFCRESTDQMPVFHTLKILELDAFFRTRWDIVLSLFLGRSPLLETLVFPKGLCVDIDGRYIGSNLCRDERKASQKEAEAWRTNEAIPAHYMSCLGRIQLHNFYDTNRELNMINFFLRQAPVLKDLEIRVHEGFYPTALQRQLEEVARGMNSCSLPGFNKIVFS